MLRCGFCSVRIPQHSRHSASRQCRCLPRRDGETGRRTGLKILYRVSDVRVRSPAPGTITRSARSGAAARIRRTAPPPARRRARSPLPAPTTRLLGSALVGRTRWPRTSGCATSSKPAGLAAPRLRALRNVTTPAHRQLVDGRTAAMRTPTARADAGRSKAMSWRPTRRQQLLPARGVARTPQRGIQTDQPAPRVGDDRRVVAERRHEVALGVEQ